MVTDLNKLDRALGQHNPDVALLDLMWREISVLERLGELVRRHPLVRICMYTNYAAPRLVLDAFRAGAIGYLLKPAEVSEICEAATEVAAGRRYLSAELRDQPELVESISSGTVLVIPLTKPVRGTKEWDRAVAWLQYDLHSSYREAEIMLLSRQGLTKGEVAVVLEGSEHTVASHCDDIYGKFRRQGVRNATSLSALVCESLERRPRDWVRQVMTP